MAIASCGDDSPAGCALEEADLDEIGFDDVFEGMHFLAGNCGDSLESGWTAFEFLDNTREHAAVGRFETKFVDFEESQSITRYFPSDVALVVYLGKVTDTLEDAIGHTWGTATGPGDFLGPEIIEGDTEDFGRTPHDLLYFISCVKLEPVCRAETIPEGIGEGAEAGRSADEGKAREIELDGARSWALADNDIEFVILHGWIEHFLDCFIEPVNFVDKEYIAWFEIGEDTSKVANTLNSGTTCYLDPSTHFPCDDMSEGGFAESGGTIEEDVVDRLTAIFGCSDKELEVLFDFFLADILRERLRPQSGVENFIFFLVGRSI